MLNVTPDSFSDGGTFYDPRAAIEQVDRLLEQGADVLDIGGESSRPKGQTYGEGAEVVPVFEELRRVLPAIQHAVARGAKVSIDTVKPEVARQALSAGARIVNDVSCASNPDLLQVVAEAGAELVIMHNRGRGERDGDNVRYADVTCEVSSELGQAVERAVAMGVAREDIWLDPGIGFAKTGAQSASLIAATHELVALGYRVLMGPSRKSFIAELAPRADGRAPQAGERLPGTLAAVLLCALGGCHAVRVHDVAETHQALAVLGACVRRRA